MRDDETRIEKLDAPSAETPHDAKRNLVTVLTTDLNEVGVGLTTMAAGYGAKKIMDKFREPPESGPKPHKDRDGDPGPEAGPTA